MPVDVRSLMEVLAEISEEKHLRVALKENLKGGLLAGAAAMMGGLVLGPIGLALGGALGGAGAAALSQGKFKPVAEVILNMPRDKKLLLYTKIQKAFSNFGYSDITTVITLIATCTDLKELALKEVINFLTTEMTYKIQ